MDEFMLANIKAAKAMSSAENTPRGGDNEKKTALRKMERDKLLESRRKRGNLVFLDRMATDINDKIAYREIAALRQNPQHRAVLDRQLERITPAAAPPGPRIVVHKNNVLYEGHDKEVNWAPLECY
eukprot:gnl/TRDRNA2_/TRDRNA2_157959_c0_seq1.p1 gnl/TRDRNA2_/TRDRNA2_157959_c0~~gnl/TRDRNA2_/TRDRNA2_157959_c0_seq1.p1  ORF type:complete len:126 (+),score=16.40 gnl/TRDRNA2_/TRDRNA2_157959_c0_seq1:72-449(+)